MKAPLILLPLVLLGSLHALKEKEFLSALSRAYNQTDLTKKESLFNQAKGYLSREDFDLNFISECGDSLLTYALKHGDEDIARALLEQGANPDQLDGNGKLPLLIAFEKDWESLSQSSKEASSEKGRIEWRLATLLWKKGAHINCGDSAGRTVFSSALNYGELAPLRWVVVHYADVSKADDSGLFPLTSLLGTPHDNALVPFALDKGGGSAEKVGISGEALCRAIRLKSELFRQLLQRADPNQRDANGWSPLGTAVKYAGSGEVKALVAAGAKVNEPIQVTDEKVGPLPLTQAALDRHGSVFDVLFESGVRDLDNEAINQTSSTLVEEKRKLQREFGVVEEMREKLYAVQLLRRLRWSGMSSSAVASSALIGSHSSSGSSLHEEQVQKD